MKGILLSQQDLDILRTQDLIVSMIKESLLDLAEADTIKKAWEKQHRFRLKIESFTELLSAQE